MPKSPAPVSWPPSQFWDGDDGDWSSFTLRVGNPEQTVRVLPSTAGQETWVVLPKGCQDGEPGKGKSTSQSCSDSRGGLFNLAASTSFKRIGNYSLGPFEHNLGTPNDTATYGLDTVSLGFAKATGGPSLDSQVVSTFATDTYYTGMFGLGHQGTNFTNLTNTHTGYLTTMKEKNLIPSLSWAYTAGAKYRNKGVFGSLTFGGYDSSRFIPNKVSFDLAPDITRDLVVGLQSVSASGTNGTVSLLPTPALTFIDSTLPYIYLPLDACSQFEKAFGLQWSKKLGLYTVNDTAHQNLLSTNPNFTFTLGNSETGGETVDIVLPYASFDLMTEYPAVSNSTRYFPLQRAANDSQYTLGRAFLQEAYLITNYEQSNFSVSQCNFEAGLKQHLITIPGTSSGSSTSRGAIIGASVGAAIFLVLSILLAVFFCIRRKGKKQSQREIPEFMDFKDPPAYPQDIKNLADFAIHEIGSNNDWRTYYEVPENGKVELLDAKSLGNQAVEMFQPSEPVELMTQRASKDSSKGSSKELPLNGNVAHLRTGSGNLIMELPQSPTSVLRESKTLCGSNRISATEKRHTKNRFSASKLAIFVKNGISRKSGSSLGTSKGTPGVETVIFSTGERNSVRSRTSFETSSDASIEKWISSSAQHESWASMKSSVHVARPSAAVLPLHVPKSLQLDRSLPPTPISESPATSPRAMHIKEHFPAARRGRTIKIKESKAPLSKFAPETVEYVSPIEKKPWRVPPTTPVSVVSAAPSTPISDMSPSASSSSDRGHYCMSSSSMDVEIAVPP